MTHPIRQATFGQRGSTPAAASADAPPVSNHVFILGGFGLLACMAVGIWSLTGPAEVDASRNALPIAATQVEVPVGPMGAFITISDRFRAALKCGKIDAGLATIGAPDYGRLYSCTYGDAGLAKLFVNEDGNGNVKNVKVMWNDSRVEIDVGERLGMRDYFTLLNVVSKVYPGLEFFEMTRISNGQTGEDLTAPADLRAYYKFHKGPLIDERLVVIEPR